MITNVDATTYNVAVSAKTPDGQPTTNTMEVILDATTVGMPEFTAPIDYDAVTFPNPFTSNTNLKYSLKEAEDVNIVLYDLQGRVLQEFDQGKQSAGTYELNLDGSMYAPGMYIAIITGNEGSQAIQLTKQ